MRWLLQGGFAVLEDCTVEANGRHGVEVTSRDTNGTSLTRCFITKNKASGVALGKVRIHDHPFTSIHCYY